MRESLSFERHPAEPDQPVSPRDLPPAAPANDVAPAAESKAGGAAEAEAREEAREDVIEAVEQLGLGLDLEKHPRLVEAMVNEGEHFEDGVVMAEIVRKLYVPLREALGLPEDKPEGLMLATLLQDIGKAGPVNASEEYARAIHELFVPPQRKFDIAEGTRLKSVTEYLRENPELDGARIAAALLAEGIDPAEEKMIDFWRRHADWTLKRLTDELGDGISADVATVAASHHLLEDRNPAAMDLEHVGADAHQLELLKKAQVVTAVDQYQALRDRAGMGHEQAVRSLREKVARVTGYPEPLRQAFLAALDVIARSKEEIEPLLAPAPDAAE